MTRLNRGVHQVWEQPCGVWPQSRDSAQKCTVSLVSLSLFERNKGIGPMQVGSSRWSQVGCRYKSQIKSGGALGEKWPTPQVPGWRTPGRKDECEAR